MNLSQEDLIKFQEILLNNVDNLKWSYFEIDLNNLILDSNHKFIETDYNLKGSFLEQVLCKIEFKDGKYSYPEPLNDEDKQKLVNNILYESKKNPQILKDSLERIFKNSRILNNSEADEGNLGNLNRKEKKRRDKEFYSKINGGFKANPNNYVVLAEGDSWFQFPKLFIYDAVKDILDHLINRKNIAVYSMAAGGDWLSNIMRAGEFIEELPKMKPDAFLISGGGNDMVGDKRLATMLSQPINSNSKLKEKHQKLFKLRESSLGSNKSRYEEGLKYTNSAFLDFINICFLQYFIFFHNIIINTDKYKELVFITQGYDYAIPSNKKYRQWWNPVQAIVNWFEGSGKWLYTPCMMAGIVDQQIQKNVLFASIYEFNEMLIQVVNFKGFPKVFHVDCRGLADKDDWFDELHLKSSKFEEIANVYYKVIEENCKQTNSNTKKVFKVKAN